MSQQVLQLPNPFVVTEQEVIRAADPMVVAILAARKGKQPFPAFPLVIDGYQQMSEDEQAVAMRFISEVIAREAQRRMCMELNPGI